MVRVVRVSSVADWLVYWVVGLGGGSGGSSLLRRSTDRELLIPTAGVGDRAHVEGLGASARPPLVSTASSSSCGSSCTALVSLLGGPTGSVRRLRIYVPADRDLGVVGERCSGTGGTCLLRLGSIPSTSARTAAGPRVRGVHETNTAVPTLRSTSGR